MDFDGINGPSSYTGLVTIVFGNVDGGDRDFAIVLLNTKWRDGGRFHHLVARE